MRGWKVFSFLCIVFSLVSSFAHIPFVQKQMLYIMCYYIMFLQICQRFFAKEAVSNYKFETASYFY